MPKPVSYTPPAVLAALDGAPAAPVRRRHVFYLPGYDPEARSRYRLLFVRELTLYAKRFGGGKREIGRASLSADGLVQSWSVKPHPESGEAETGYDTLLWDDLVAKDAARSKVLSVMLLVVGTLHAIGGRYMFTFYRLHWKYGNIIAGPFVMVLLLGLAAAAIAWFVEGWIGPGSQLGLPAYASIPLGLAAGFAPVWAVQPLLHRIYFWQILKDWVFNWQHGQGWRPDYAGRLERFVDHMQARLANLKREGRQPDEILIVGHSTGALTAVETAARLIARDPAIGTDGPALSLLTLGSGLPIVALQRRASGVRAEIASLVTSRRITWVDYVAPQDWLNFPWFNPLFDLDLPLAPDAVIVNPIIRSARFRDIIDEETYRKVRFRPFRMHFQFLMANDRPGPYDFFAMTLGPLTLRERALERGTAIDASRGSSQATPRPASCTTGAIGYGSVAA